MASQRITLRAPDDLIAALRRAAKKQSTALPIYIRQVLGAAVGVAAGEMPEGWAALDPDHAAEIRMQGTAASAIVRGKKKSRK